MPSDSTTLAPLPVGPILIAAFRLFARNAAALTVLSLVMGAPLVVWMLMEDGGAAAAEPEPLAVVGLLYLSLAAQQVATAGVVFAVLRHLRGAPGIDVGAALAAAIGAIVPVLGTALVVSGAVVVGWMALIVPGFVAACALEVAVAVVVVEGKGIRAALAESLRLTRGNRLRIFAVLLAFGAIQALVTLLGERVVFEPESPGARWVGIVSFVVLGAVGAVVDALVYHHLRTAADGGRPAEVARVFE